MTEINRPRARVFQSAPAPNLKPHVAKVDRTMKRHSGLFEAVRRLDTGMDARTAQQIARWIGEQYRIEYGSVLLGMVGMCYLGSPYVDHRLDLLGSIVEHYAPSDPMPPPFDSARMLARTGAYAFIEVHSNGDLIPVLDDGSPS